MDILGPSTSTANAVTARPNDTRIFGDSDTWFKDCSQSGVQDGTKFVAGWFNGIMAQMRRAIRGMGIVENNADDDMLLKAIKAAAASTIFAAAVTQPTHLEILAASGVFTFATSSGQTIINAGQQFVYRGLVQYSTDSFSVSDRTFATTSNKTYHLRWHAPGTGNAQPAANYPSGRFVLKDLADVSYNPTAADEKNSGFDGTYDDALLARIVTNGSNTLTVTPLANRAVLVASFAKSTAQFNSLSSNLGWSGLPALTAAINWSRTPQWAMRDFSAEWTESIDTVAALASSVSRYSCTALLQGYSDDAAKRFISGTMTMEARA